ncbi:MAG TPA: sulfite exporter TauE/SafE family protein [Patescibacteria group bacterium]|nr:sulfite exporter TauE/SafE family protein [Patescibacteria group bacterium]
MLTVLIGFASGIISGMGIGGGTLLIPALVFIIGTQQQIAQSINLLVFVPSAIAALCVHTRKKNIEKGLLLKLAVTGCAGAVIGSLLAVNLDSNLLKRFFGIFLLIMGIYEITSKSKTGSAKTGKEGCK